MSSVCIYDVESIKNKEKSLNKKLCPNSFHNRGTLMANAQSPFVSRTRGSCGLDPKAHVYYVHVYMCTCVLCTRFIYRKMQTQIKTWIEN